MFLNYKLNPFVSRTVLYMYRYIRITYGLTRTFRRSTRSQSPRHNQNRKGAPLPSQHASISPQKAAPARPASTLTTRHCQTSRTSSSSRSAPPSLSPPHSGPSSSPRAQAARPAAAAATSGRRRNRKESVLPGATLGNTPCGTRARSESAPVRNCTARSYNMPRTVFEIGDC